MQSLFDVILRFCNLQKRLYQSVLEQVHKLQRTRFQIVERTHKSKWGIDEAASTQRRAPDTFTDPAEIEGVQARIATEYASHVTAIAQDYRNQFTHFLACLRPTPSENLKMLRFRLDFNLHYETTAQQHN